jgi:hypothetical protein
MGLSYPILAAKTKARRVWDAQIVVLIFKGQIGKKNVGGASLLMNWPFFTLTMRMGIY